MSLPRVPACPERSWQAEQLQTPPCGAMRYFVP